MAKRELIDRKELYVPSDENDYDELVQFADDVMKAQVITEQEIVKPYLDKLKHQIHEKTFESGMMNPIMTYAEIMSMIDNLLSERGEEEWHLMRQ